MKLYVGNLPHSFDEGQLEELFAEFGAIVSCKIIFDRETNRSKGFGFIEFGSKEEALKAISELNGKEVGGRVLTVSEALPQRKREGTGGGGNRPHFKRRF